MKSLSQTYLFDRYNREDWENKGRPEIYDRAFERTKDLLKSHVPEPLDQTAVRQLRAIVEKAEKELAFR